MTSSSVHLDEYNFGQQIWPIMSLKTYGPSLAKKPVTQPSLLRSKNCSNSQIPVKNCKQPNTTTAQKHGVSIRMQTNSVMQRMKNMSPYKDASRRYKKQSAYQSIQTTSQTPQNHAFTQGLLVDDSRVPWGSQNKLFSVARERSETHEDAQ